MIDAAIRFIALVHTSDARKTLPFASTGCGYLTAQTRLGALGGGRICRHQTQHRVEIARGLPLVTHRQGGKAALQQCVGMIWRDLERASCVVERLGGISGVAPSRRSQ